ncbi:ubiquinol-cytochrome c reductase cytochrome b subunit [Verrucomicrobium sp. GAS474]|uniref:cytochrome b N-terminal domain-containing protein n=1 Tax=Verrucomicrobium sp. GAS474 TaxID=1882831 RepID=UPI00087A0BD8|nr:cytochrome b N-terminal domain-containing protein [Verrucomicrobium sp. GAS474]SDU22682.1 ubiquinol-cytochrome c reductase cytochrome b subunit [Verrucomicrobium sp. GAS474]
MLKKTQKLVIDSLEWMEDRTGIWAMFGPVLTHLAPKDAKWWYVYGSATLMAFMIQVATGVALMFSYIPSGGQAYDSLKYIADVAPWGHLIRGMHYFGASAMILLIGIHMGQVFFHGSYKFPREMNWVTGIFLLAFTLGLGFTGQTLRWDSNAVWSIVVAAEQAARVPVIGHWLAHFILAGDNVNGATLGRFFTMHVFVLPALAIAGIGLHMVLVMRHGIAEMPNEEHPVIVETYREEYHARLEKTGIPFWLMAWRDSFFSLFVVLAVLAAAIWFEPPPVELPPDPSIIETSPTPDFYLKWYLAVLSLAQSDMEDYIILGAPAFLGILLFAVPFLSNSGHRSPSKRPWSVVALITAYLFVGGFWVAGEKMDWTPKVHPKPITAEFIGATEGPIWHGAQLFQDKGCYNCHQMGHDGGKKGPDLTFVGDRLKKDNLVIRINMGGVNMPGYAGNMEANDLRDLVAFLEDRKRKHSQHPEELHTGQKGID